jgi:hypothetical protein
MKQTVLLTESELVKVITRITEAYEDLDYMDAFFRIFRQWLDEKYGETVKKYPFALLLKKYGKDFLIDKIGDGELENYIRRTGELEINRWNIERFVKLFIEKGIHKMESLNPDEKFLDKYKKQIPFFIENLELPPYIRLELEEKKPYSLEVGVHIDYPEMLKSNDKQSYRNGTSKIRNELIKNFENYLGVEMGNPDWGELRVEDKKPVFNNLDSWVKEEFTKGIKKEIKSSQPGKYIHSIKLEPYEGKLEMKVRFKSDAGWNERSKVKNEIKRIFEKEGYNIEKIDIET